MGLDYTSAIKITASWAGQPGVDQAKRGIVDLKAQATGSIQAFQGAANAIRGFGAALAVREIINYGKSIIDLGDDLNDLRQKTGVSVQALSALKTAGELNGVSFDQLQVSLKKFNVVVSGAAHGSKEAESAFKAAGVSLRSGLSGNIKNTSQLLFELANRFEKMKDGPDKAAIAVKLFGRAGADLIPLLNQGGEEIQKFGLRISDDFALRADQFNDSLTIMGVQAKQIGVDILDGLLPTLQEIANAFTSGNAEETLDWVEGLGEALRQVAAIGVAAWLVLEESYYGFKVAILLAADALIYLKDTFFDLGIAGKAVIRGLQLDFEGAAAAWRDYSEAQQKSQSKFYDSATARGDKYVADTIAGFEKAKKRFDALQRNSLIFGEGTAAEIRERQRKGTKPTAKKGGTDAGAGGELDQGNASAIKAIEDRIQKIRAETGALNDSNATRAIASELAQLDAKFTDKTSAAYSRLRKELEGVTYAREVAKEKQQAADYLGKEKGQAELRKLELNQSRYSTAEYQKLVEAKKQEIAVSESTKRSTKEGTAAMVEAAESVRQMKNELIDLEEQQRRSVGEGARQAWREYAEAARDTAAQTKMVLTDAFRGAEDAFVDFVRTGKLSFSSLAKSIEEDLLRIAFRKTITGIGSAIFGAAVSGAAGAGGGGAAFAGGGIMSSRGPVPLKKYAAGGVANSPQVALFGEGSRPEAYVPLPDGRRIPVAMQGGSGTSITVNVNGAGSQVESNPGASDQGKQLGKVVAAVVNSAIQRELRPGGLLAK
ncbi:MAG: phage tail tape measure C-terminal domain-containing protein [Kiritimatiellia bacterium]